MTQNSFELSDSQKREIGTWAEFESAVRNPDLRGWAFRGQASASWPLVSSLSRHLRTYGLNRKAWAIQERRILTLFQRKAHLFLEHIPDANDYFRWLGLMQHHGAPTRLIDFTWSPEVAAFFALERAQPGSNCAVWAVAIPKLWSCCYTFGGTQVAAKELSLRYPENYEKYYLNNQVPFVSTDDPFVMNQRIIAQSGTFVVPGLLDLSIDQIVSEQGGNKPEDWIVKLELNVDSVRSDAMKGLYRMNVSNATLFPGLDGTARSLAYELENHWAYDTRTFLATGGYDAEFETLKRWTLKSGNST